MMISYLAVIGSCQLVRQYNMPYLFHLIGLALRTFWLKIQDFSNTLFRENMMAATESFFKAQPQEKLPHRAKRNIRIRVAAQDLFERFVGTRHRRCCLRGQE